MKNNTEACKECGDLVVNMERHYSVKHPDIVAKIEAGELLSSAPASVAPPTKVRFLSPKSPGLTVVVSPEHWGTVKTPVGDKMMLAKGKSATFVNGVFETNDPEIIEYLEEVYKDPRFPVLSSRISNELVAAEASRQAGG